LLLSDTDQKVVPVTVPAASPPLRPDDAALSRARRTMVDSQLKTVGIIDAAILEAMAAVQREHYLPAALAPLAYSDAALAVAPGRWLLEPMTLALLLQHAGLQPTDSVLVVGGAAGYSAAVIAQAGARVDAVESDEALLAIASVPGGAIHAGPLAGGWAAAAPYDLILFEGAIETIPDAIAAQLAPGGRVAAVWRDAGVGGAMAGPLMGAPGLWTIGGLPFLEVAARPLPGFARPRQFAF
jgi:protein-L-isoaspartate(D-aspartate) O-methyltransferase